MLYGTITEFCIPSEVRLFRTIVADRKAHEC